MTKFIEVLSEYPSYLSHKIYLDISKITHLQEDTVYSHGIYTRICFYGGFYVWVKGSLSETKTLLGI